MKPPYATLGLLTVFSVLAACSGDDRPMGATRDGGPQPDRSLFSRTDADPEAGMTPDGTVTPKGDVPATMDTGANPTDVTSTPDAPGADIVDAPPSLPVFCTNVRDARMAALAVRFATCAREAPQTTLNRMFDPRFWESGPLAQRACPMPSCPNCPALFDCAATARGCSEVMSSCLKYSVTPAAGGMCASTAGTCEGMGRIAARCERNVNIFDQCEASGGRCVASSTESVCAPERSDMCPPGAPPRCVVGNVLQRCIAGVYVPVSECARNVGTCDSARNDCVGAGDACTGDAVSCDGTRLRVCRNGRAQFLDCGQFVQGASCQTVAGHSFCGVAADCDPTTAPANGNCEGSTLVVCAGGRQTRIDCGTSSSTGAGFRGCGPTGCIPDI